MFSNEVLNTNNFPLRIFNINILSFSVFLILNIWYDEFWVTRPLMCTLLMKRGQIPDSKSTRIKNKILRIIFYLIQYKILVLIRDLDQHVTIFVVIFQVRAIWSYLEQKFFSIIYNIIYISKH